jgi:DNA-binding NarL/FixJ family response regulator
MITVLLADDHALIRKGFRLILNAEPDIEVVGEVSDGTAAVSMASALPSKVLILTTIDLDDYVYAGLRAGASGVLLKDTQPDDLVTAIRTIASGDAVLAPGATSRLIRQFATPTARATQRPGRRADTSRPHRQRARRLLPHRHGHVQ